MSSGCGVIEVGPQVVRQLCCGAGAQPDLAAIALDGIDDPVVLVDDRPVSVGSVWLALLRSLDCAERDHLLIVHPSWWAPTRIAVVRAAAQMLSNDVVMQPRKWLLARAAPADSAQPPVVVEIAETLVVVAHTALQAEPRRDEPRQVAQAVARIIGAIGPATVVVDAPDSVAGAHTLATMIADELAPTDGSTVVQVDDARVRQLATRTIPAQQSCRPSVPARGARRRRTLVLIGALIATVLGWCAVDRHEVPTNSRAAATTFLVEGRVVVEVPAHWTMQRVTAGPGSARVQVTSPSDPQLVLHVTQSPIGAATLAGAAETLKHAIDAEPPDVFVDFNPSGSIAGRPALTYREVRAGHDIRWAVMVDKAVRIAIGCQSPTGADEAVRDACEQAIRSAHAVS